MISFRNLHNITTLTSPSTALNPAVRIIFVNLPDNSFKYTPSKGKINNFIKHDCEKVEIIIKATGVGISENDLPFIFERFSRCDKSRSEEGFGLGLSLADTIARYHGGNIKAESALGKGSVFTVALNQHLVGQMPPKA